MIFWVTATEIECAQLCNTNQLCLGFVTENNAGCWLKAMEAMQDNSETWMGLHTYTVKGKSANNG